MQRLLVKAVAATLRTGLAGEELPAPALGGGGGILTLLHLDIFQQPVITQEVVRD